LTVFTMLCPISSGASCSGERRAVRLVRPAP
jgi:hypothetical protein